MAARAPFDALLESVDERARHADPVLDLGEILVLVLVWQRATGEEVVLVGGVDEAATEQRRRSAPATLDDLEDRASLVGGVRAHRLLAGVAADTERDDADRGKSRIALQNAGHRVLERLGVVHPRADDDLAMHLDAVLEEQAQPSQARRAAPVAQHLGAQVGIGGMDRDVQRREPLLDDPLEVELGEPCQRREVAVEKGETEVVVLHVEALPHPLGELVDETESTVVVTGADAVEQWRGDLDPERLAGVLVDSDLEVDPAPTDLESTGKPRRRAAGRR